MCTSCCALKAEFNDFLRNRRSAISFEKISKNVDLFIEAYSAAASRNSIDFFPL